MGSSVAKEIKLGQYGKALLMLRLRKEFKLDAEGSPQDQRINKLILSLEAKL